MTYPPPRAHLSATIKMLACGEYLSSKVHAVLNVPLLRLACHISASYLEGNQNFHGVIRSKLEIELIV